MIITNVVDWLWCPGQSCSSASGFGLANRCDSNRCDSHINLNAPGRGLMRTFTKRQFGDYIHPGKPHVQISEGVGYRR